MQKRQPMQRDASKRTGPTLVFLKAVIGQTEAQAGSLQCMHSWRPKANSFGRRFSGSPVNLIRVKVCST